MWRAGAPTPPQAGDRQAGPAHLSHFPIPADGTATHLATFTLNCEAVRPSGYKHELCTKTDQESRSGFDPYCSVTLDKFLSFAQVQIDRTRTSLVGLLKELKSAHNIVSI